MAELPQPSSVPSSNWLARRLWWIVPAGLVASVVAVYGQTARHELLTWDDLQHIVANPNVNPPSWAGVARSWREPYWGLYAPLSYTWFAAEAALALRRAPDGTTRLDPAVFHLGNVLLHAGSTLLVYWLLRRLLARSFAPAACWTPARASPSAIALESCASQAPATPTGAPSAASPATILACGAAAALFALHPVQVESVAWVSEGRGLLCAFWSLVALWQWVVYWQSGDGRAAVRHYAAATAAYVLALLSKPAAVAVPLMAGVLAVGWFPAPSSAEASGRSWRAAARSLAPWFVGAAAWTVLTKLLQPDADADFVAPWWARPLVAGDALAFYLSKLVAPWGLCPDYGRSPRWVMAQGTFYVAWLVPAALVASLACLRGRRVWLTAVGLSVAWLVPVLGFVPFEYQRISTVADRYLYLAMFGPALALAWLLRQGLTARGDAPTPRGATEDATRAKAPSAPADLGDGSRGPGSTGETRGNLPQSPAEQRP